MYAHTRQTHARTHVRAPSVRFNTPPHVYATYLAHLPREISRLPFGGRVLVSRRITRDGVHLLIGVRGCTSSGMWMLRGNRLVNTITTKVVKIYNFLWKFYIQGVL